MERIKKTNLKLNEKKCVVGAMQIRYLGYILSEEGRRIDPERIEALEKIKIPQSKKDVRSLLGMINFCRDYIPNCSQITASLSKMIHKDVEFVWTSEQQTAFDSVLRILKSAPPLSLIRDDQETSIKHVAGEDNGVADALSRLLEIKKQKKKETLHFIKEGAKILSDDSLQMKILAEQKKKWQALAIPEESKVDSPYFDLSVWTTEQPLFKLQQLDEEQDVVIDSEDDDEDIVEFVESQDMLKSEDVEIQVMMHQAFKEYHETVKSLEPARVHPVVLELIGGAKEVAQPPRKVPYHYQELEREMITDLLKKGFRKSSSSFASPILLVPKKNGQMHMCIDYRELNKLLVHNRHPIPRPEDLFQILQGKSWFASFDIKNGYYACTLARESQEITAFCTPFGLYEWLRLPFGLKIAPAYFQRIMTDMLGDLRSQGVVVYLDDILICAETKEKLVELVKEVLRRLQEKNSIINVGKSFVGKQKIRFLGFEFSEEGKRIVEDEFKR
ncbi:hypothetical protein ADUPG1_006378 [Aduncisulcus paluster]|uniref:Reverse transcriptase domain-containing protein n=1 Tax=Aduncisulcus paluster TaxID=2918883 RepID=A0ABQ5KI28_9EUKA|nr:hypothetical protein ADUPG1_006378 [Aduncisulcus paluster]